MYMYSEYGSKVNHT